MLSINDVCELKDTARHVEDFMPLASVTSRIEESISILTSQREIPAHPVLGLQQN